VAEVERLAGHPLVDAEAELNPDENTNGTKP